MGPSTFVRARATVALVAVVTATLVAVVAPPPAFAATFTFEAVANDATHSTSVPAISADGRFVAFDTLAALSAEDTNGRRDVYLREVASGATTRVSIPTSGGSFLGEAFGPKVSGDGSRVAFSVDFVEGGTDVYLRDLATSTTVRVNQTTSLLIGGTSVADDISDDGTAVVWTTDREAGDFVAGFPDGNGATDVMLTTVGADLSVTHQVVSLDEDSNGTQNADSWDGSVNSDGTTVAFLSLGDHDLGGMHNSLEDVWIWNGSTFPVTGVTFIGHDPFGAPLEGAWNNRSPVMLDDGRAVFVSEEPLVAEDTNGTADVYAWTGGNTWERLVRGFEDQLYVDVVTVDVTADGSTLVFTTSDTTVLDGVVAGTDRHVYRLDRVTGEVVLVTAAGGTPHAGNHDDPVISDTGDVIALVSPDGLAPGDANGAPDVVVATEGTATPPAATPVLTAATPTTGLDPAGGTVSVQGTGFSPGSTVSVRQCADVAATLTCTASGAVSVVSDPAGAFTVAVPVSDSTDAFTTCPEGGCVVRAHDGAGLGPQAHSVWINPSTTSVATGPSLCPDGLVMTGMDVRTDFIGGDATRGIVVTAAARCGVATGPMIGEAPGVADGTSQCPGTGQVTGLGGRHGDLLDLLYVICRDADTLDVPTGAGSLGGEVGDVDGNPGGTPFDSVSCPVGMFAVGIDGAHLNAFDNPLQSLRLVCSDVGGSRVDIAFAVPSEPRDLTGVALSTSPGTGGAEAGLDRVPIADIPVGSIPFANVAIGATPLKSIDLSSSPLKSIPLKSIPLKSIPLKSITLSQLPLELDGGWAARLVGTPLQGLPLQTVTLAQVADVQAQPHPLDGIDLSQVGIQSSPLKSIGLASIALGSTPLKSIPLKSIDTSVADPDAHVCPLVDGAVPTDPTVIAANWENLLACLGFTTTVGTDTTLIDIDIAGAPLKSIPLKSIPLKSIDLSSSPLKSIPLKSIELSATPLKSIPLKSIVFDVASSPLKSIPLKSIPLKSIATNVEASPLKSIPLKSIPFKANVVDCQRVDCTDTDTNLQTLGDAANLDPSAIRDDATLEQLGETLAGYTLGDLMGVTGDATIGDVQAWLIATQGDAITLADVLIGLLLRTDYPWEELPVADMRLQNVAPTADRITGSLSFATNGAPNAGEQAVVKVTLPSGAAYEPGSTVMEISTLSTTSEGGLGFAALDTSDPAVHGDVLTWTVGNLDDTTIDLSFAYRPGVRLVEEQASATVTVGPVGGEPAASETVAATPYLVGERSRSDDDPATAPELGDGNTLVVGHIADADDIDYYRIPATAVAGKRVSIDLAVPGVDQDLVLYSPVQSAGVIDSTPLKSIPLKSIAVEDEGVVRPGEVVPPETLQDIPLKSIPLKSISANRDATDESVDMLANEDPAGEYVIQVSGYNGASSTEPYVLRMRVTDPPEELHCPESRVLPYQVAAPTTLTATPAPAGTNALYVVNPSRIDATHGIGEGARVVAALEQLDDDPALGLVGHVLEVDGDEDVRAAYAAWDGAPCSPNAANDVVDAIVGLVEASHASAGATIPHLVLVGGDDVLPQARIPDLTRLSNERDYLQDVGLDNPLAGAFATEHLLSDDPYGDRDPIPWLNRLLYVPDAALGRLVETPDEIVDAIDRFMTWDGSLDPSTATSTVSQDALVTGYDFLADGAHAVADALVDALPSNTPVDRTLISETWTRQNLVDNLLLADIPYVGAVNAHFDHYRSLPGEGNATHDESDLFTTADVVDPDADPTTAPPALDQRLLFSMGCHSGLNVPDVYVQGIEDADWAQTLAQQGAGAYVANTGFGYGDTAAVALSEKLMAEFANRLDGTMTVGQAMTYAKQAYAAQLGIYGAYDEKVLAEATFYGLPMFHVSDQPGSPADGPETATVPVPGATGVTSSSFSLGSTDLATQTRTAPDGSQFLTVGNEVPQVTSGRPITPRTDRDVTPTAGPQARGVLLTGLTSTEATVQKATFARAVVDQSSREPAIATDVAFPASFASVNRYRDPLGERSQLVLMPGQFVPDKDPATVGTGTQRTFTQMQGTVYYSDSEDVTPPTFASTAGRANASTVTFTAELDEEVSDVLRVLVLYRDAAGPWKSVELAPSATAGTWTGTGPVLSEEVEYLVQAVDTAGNVATTTNKGFLFAAAVDTVPPTVTVTSPVAGFYEVGESLSIDYACADANLSDCTATLNGTPVPSGGVVDTSQPSSFNSLEVVGTDAFGNTTTQTVTFHVSYTFEGFSAPIAAGQRTTVKAGAAVPVRWQLSDANGYVSDRSAIVDIRSYAFECGAVDTGATATIEGTTEVSGLTYDTETNEWQYVWKTQRKWHNTCRQLVVTFADGQTASAVFEMT